MTKLDEATITSQGQINLPKKVREKLHIEKGDKIAFMQDKKGQIFLSVYPQEVELTKEEWALFLDKVNKEPVTRLHGKKAFLEHLDRLSSKSK